MSRRLRWAMVGAGLALLGIVSAGEAAAQCQDPEQIDIPDGFMVGAHLTALSDAALSHYLIGFVNGTLFSIVLGSDEKCVDQLTLCLQGRPARQLVAQVRAYIAERPQMMTAQASRVGFNAVFGPCFTEFVPSPAEKS